MSVYKPKNSPKPEQKNGNDHTVHSANAKRVRNREVERAYSREYYKKHRDRIRAQVRAREEANGIEAKRAKNRKWFARDRVRNRAKYLWISAKYRAIDRGMEFSITVDDIVIPSKCPILGIEIKIESGRASHSSSPSLDRIDNEIGYTPENIRVISHRANRLKCDMTLEEAKTLIENWYAK